MPDMPEVKDGTLQPSGRIATRFHLNDAFVASIGEEKAEQFLNVLLQVSQSHGGRDREEIEKELARGFKAIGVEPAEGEIGNFADQINRSEIALGPVDPSQVDPEAGHSGRSRA